MKGSRLRFRHRALGSVWSHLGRLSGGGDRCLSEILELISSGRQRARREEVEVEERAQGTHGPMGTGPEPGDRHVGQGGKRLFSSFSGEETASGAAS